MSLKQPPGSTLVGMGWREELMLETALREGWSALGDPLVEGETECPRSSAVDAEVTFPCGSLS